MHQNQTIKIVISEEKNMEYIICIIYTKPKIYTISCHVILRVILCLIWFVGKSVGVVTTARLTHATPGAAYSHSASRGWEGLSNMEGVESQCTDIAYQLVMNNSDIDVRIGWVMVLSMTHDLVVYDNEPWKRYVKQCAWTHSLGLYNNE